MTAPLPPALVLTAGLGTRLTPLTNLLAKPAVPVAGTPLILRLLKWLASQDVPSAVLNLHHLPDTITRHVGHGTDSRIRVRYSWEPTILGTAGGARRALPLLGPRFFVINGDTLTNIDLHAMTRGHEASGAQVTLAVTTNPAPDRYGSVTVDDHGWVRGFTQPGPRSRLHFVGVQLVEAQVFGTLRDGEPAASIGGVYDKVMTNIPRAIDVHWTTSPFYDVGTPADYLATSLALARIEGLSSLPHGNGSHVHTTASLTRAAIWDNVIIEAGCRLVDCIVTDGVRLPQNSVCVQQVITVAGTPSVATGQRLGNVSLTPLGHSQAGGERS